MKNFYSITPRKRQPLGTYPGQWWFDSVNRKFYRKTIPDFAVPEAEFNKRFYFHTVDPEERDSHDPAGVIKSIRIAEVHGRVWEPENPASIIERDGLKYVNVRQSYNDAINAQNAKKAA